VGKEWDLAFLVKVVWWHSVESPEVLLGIAAALNSKFGLMLSIVDSQVVKAWAKSYMKTDY
jgi:hypothetical protein